MPKEEDQGQVVDGGTWGTTGDNDGPVEEGFEDHFVDNKKASFEPLPDQVKIYALRSKSTWRTS